MTRYGWDASNHDWPRGDMDLALARREGISLFTHKASEGVTFTDPYFGQAMQRAKPVGFPVLGSYHVLWPDNPAAQADYWLSVVNAHAPWWRDHPCWVWQIDAELFQEFKPYRPPTVAEMNACGDRIVARTGCKPSQVVVYAPEWLYHDGLRGLRYRCLWASSYVNASGAFKGLYPGDGSDRWGPYSGIEPAILQYTSTATIAGQNPADANAIRVADDATLQALFLGDDDMSAAEVAEIKAAIAAAAADMKSQASAFYSDPAHPFSQFNLSAKLAALTAATDPAKLAAAIVGLLPPDGTVTQEMLEHALRDVLGSLDNAPTP